MTINSQRQESNKSILTGLTNELTRTSQLISGEESKTVEKIAMLNEWIVFAELQSALHSDSGVYYKFINRLFMSPIILISAITGAANLIGLPILDCNENDTKHSFRPAQFVLGLLNISTAALTAVYNFAKLGEMQESHYIHSSEFAKLARHIRVELLLHGTADRTFISLAEYIKDCKDNIDKLVERSPDIPMHVLKKQLKVARPSDYYGAEIIKSGMFRKARLSFNSGEYLASSLRTQAVRQPASSRQAANTINKTQSNQAKTTTFAASSATSSEDYMSINASLNKTSGPIQTQQEQHAAIDITTI
jgi:hypothetical protein